VPLAAASLKAQLDADAALHQLLDVSLHDYYLDRDAVAIARDICNARPDMIGFSTYLWNRQLVVECCRIIKQRMPDVVLFAGGAEATALPEALLASAPFDFVVSGEGEIALGEVLSRLLNGEDPAGIPGVCVKGGEACSDNGRQGVDVQMLHSPYLGGTIDPAAYQGLLWELSRGCPFKCAFCFESRGLPGVRNFPIDRIERELALFEEKKVAQIFVLDPTFNCNTARAKKILRMIRKTAPAIHFTFEIRAEYLDAEIARLFAQINCTLQIGLQSADPAVLEKVNRTMDPDTFAQKMALLNSAGAIFGFDLIYGLPGDTLAGFKASLDYAIALQPNHLDIFRLCVIPGTALYDMAEVYSLDYLKSAPYTLISSPGFTGADLSAAETLKKSCDIFYNQGGAVGWLFMILETLDMKASDFFSFFADYLSLKMPGDCPDRAAITALQSAFVKELFASRGMENLFAVIEDIIAIHGALNRSLYAGPLERAASAAYNAATAFTLAPATVLLELKYAFDDLMSLGGITLDEFAESGRARSEYLVIYNRGGEVKTLVINRLLYGVLKAFDGRRPHGEICAHHKGRSRGEIDEFIDYAIEVQMIQSVL